MNKRIPYAKVEETPGWRNIEVFLDGVKVKYAIEANAEEGWVIAWDGIGDLMVGPAAKKHFGTVEIIQVAEGDKEAKPHG